MTCLNDHHIQALADGEGTPEMRDHAAGCAGCGDKLRARIALMDDVQRALAVPVGVPPALASRIDAGISGSAHGATRLRTPHHNPRPRVSWAYSAVALAVATLLAVLVVAPMVRKPDATLSAAAILARSVNQLSATVTGGIELLEYELVLDGVPKEMMPDNADGTYRIRQAIDHDVRGRFHFASYGPDGGLITSIAQDPARRRRVMSLLADGQPYRFEVSLPEQDAGLSLPEMERLHMEASIAMMQASGTQGVETVDGPHGKLYRIVVPLAHVTAEGTSPVWDLAEARVLIDARDYRVTELFVSGSFLKQPYSLSYRLISHSVVGSVPPETFVVPTRPGEVVIDGEGTPVPARDVVVLSLRELTRLKQGR
jgi:hypothetical protein